MTVRHNLPTMLHGIELVRASFPQQEILLGGQALKEGGCEAAEDFPAVTYVESIDRLEDIIRERR